MFDGSSSENGEDEHFDLPDFRTILLDMFCPKRCNHSHHREKKWSGSGQDTGSANGGPPGDDAEPHEVLQVPVGASMAEIRRAYRRLALLYHPDKNNGNPNALRQFLSVQRAYDKLMAEHKKSASSAQESQADEDEDEEAKEHQRKNDYSELERQFKAEQKRFQRKAAKGKLPKGRDRRHECRKERSIPNQVYAEFAFSKHDVAVAIRYKYYMILRSLLDDTPLDEDLGRGSSALHFAAHHGDEKAAMLIMSLAGRQWFRLVEAVNDDGLTAAAVGIKFHPEARLTNMLLAWEDQVDDAESAYLYEESRIANWRPAVVILLWLTCAWYSGFRALMGSTAFTIAVLMEPSGQDQPLALCPSLGLFVASTIFFYIEVIFRDAMVNLVGVVGKVAPVCAVYFFMGKIKFTFASVSDVRSILCSWAVVYCWHECFPSIWSIWKWLLVAGAWQGSIWSRSGGNFVPIFILQGLFVRDMIACGEQFAIAVCMSSAISEHRVEIGRLCKLSSLAALWSVMQRSLSLTEKCRALVPLGQHASPSEGPSGEKSAPCTDAHKSSGNQEETYEARIKDHQLLIETVEKRQTEHGRRLVMERLRQNQGQAEQEAQTLRKKDEAAQEAERKKHEARRLEEEKLQREREHVRKEIEKLLACQGNVSDIRNALNAARRSNLKLAGHSKLVATAERRLHELEQLEAEATRREQERVASLRRAEAEEKQRLETERRRRILEEERLKKAEDKRLREALARERKEQEQQRKDEEHRRKKAELEEKKMEAQRVREEQQKMKEEIRKRKQKEKETKTLEEKALAQKLQSKAHEEQVVQQLEAHRRSEEIKIRLAQKTKRQQNGSTTGVNLQTSREGPSPPSRPNRIYEEAFSPCSSEASTLTPASSRKGLPVSPRTSRKSPQHLPPPVPPCVAEQKRHTVRTSGLVSDPVPFEAIATFATPNSGYLPTHPGLWILVLYWQGPDEYESGGWAYGKVVGDDSIQGWLPQRVLNLTDGSCS